MKLSVRSAGMLSLVAGLTACDVPTGVPRWDTTWITPGGELSIGVVELLPSALGVNGDTSAFVLSFTPVNDSWALSDFCAACPPISATVPKPAFTGTVATTFPLPADVEAVVIQGGEIDVELTNGFDFDPIRPGASADSGSITLVFRSGTTTVASLVIDGDDQSFAPGSVLNETLDFVPSTISNDLSVELTLVSPAGDVTTLSPSDALGIEISSSGVLVSSASVRVPTTPDQSEVVDLDLTAVDQGNRLKEGTIFLEIENPIGITGTMNISVQPEGHAPIVKSVPLLANSSEAQVTFIEAEIEQMVGENNAMTVSVTLPGGQIATVEPDDVISVGTRLRLTIQVGGSGDENE